MRELTPDIQVGQTLLLTLGRIRIKDGGPWSYVTRHQSADPVGCLVGGADISSTFGSVQERNSVPDNFDMLERQGIHRMGRQCRDKI